MTSSGQFEGTGGWRAFKHLANPLFWQRTIILCVRFVRSCEVPAILLTAAIVLLLIGNLCFYSELGSMSAKLNDLVVIAIFSLVLTIIGLLCFIVGFGKWLFVLTVFCRMWLSFSLEDIKSGAAASEFEVRRSLALKEVNAKKEFLIGYWIALSLKILLPIILLYLLIALKIVASPSLAGGSIISLPPAIDSLVLPVAAVLGLYISIVSSFSLPMAASSSVAPRLAIKQLVSLARKLFPQALVVILIVMLVNTFVSSPFYLSKWISSGVAFMPKESIVIPILQECWQGLTSVILWPLSLVPFCELLRSEISDAGQS